MTHSFKLSRRIARLRAPALVALVLAFGACDSADSFSPDGSTPPNSIDQLPAADDLGDGATLDAPLLATSFAGGISFGTAGQPTGAYGSLFNGALQNNWPKYLLDQLSKIKSRGGKVVLMFAGNEKYYKDADGHFSFTKWKQRIDRFKGVNFSSYVKDGTIVGHYMIDEPNDPANWNGQPVPPSMLDQMGQYSKQLWPDLPTIVRTEPRYFGSNPKYVDAAWAQYLARRGDVNDYIKRNVSEAQNRGLALIVGLNFLKGGTPNGTRMTASEVKAWGSALLSSSYPCAFISWKYNTDYLSGTGIKSALQTLRDKAESRSSKTCRGS